MVLVPSSMSLPKYAPLIGIALVGTAMYFGAPPAAEPTISDLENEYFLKTGRYLQVLPGNQLPDYETGTVKQKLGKDLPTNVTIHVYESPKGMGYQVITDEADRTTSVGYGPEAADLTWERLKPALIASTTP